LRKRGRRGAAACKGNVGAGRWKRRLMVQCSNDINGHYVTIIVTIVAVEQHNDRDSSYSCKRTATAVVIAIRA
jgi:hypothetical protein